MEFDCKEDILFLGAGFAAAAGGLLAREFWAGITNHPDFIKVPEFKREERRLLKELASQGRNYFDYEDLYSKLQKYPAHSLTAQKIVESIFNLHQGTIGRNLSVPFNQGQLLDFRRVRAFLKYFTGNSDQPGYIFSTNQDLFVENLCGVFPISKSSETFGDERPDRGHKQTIINVPGLPNSDGQKFNVDPSSIEQNVANSLSKPPWLNYIKLHGAINLTEQGQRLLLFGGAHKDPNAFTFTKVNFEIFSSCLKKCGRIFFLGFSFYDAGIVKQIKDACERRSSPLQIVIINPEPPYTFLSRFRGPAKDRIELTILPRIRHYLPCTLEEIFPGTTKPYLVDHPWFRFLKDVIGHTVDWNDY